MELLKKGIRRFRATASVPTSNGPEPTTVPSAAATSFPGTACDWSGDATTRASVLLALPATTISTSRHGHGDGTDGSCSAGPSG